MMRLESVREQVVREPRPVGRHAVDALDGADRDDVLVGALVAHHADGLHRQQHGERLPERAVEPGGVDLARRRWRRRRAGSRAAPASTSPRMRIARPGPGNGWRPRISSGRPSTRPSARTSSLKSSRSGSTSFELHALGQTADVVVALDRGRRALERDRLDHVGIERALREDTRRRGMRRAPRPRRPR